MSLKSASKKFASLLCERSLPHNKAGATVVLLHGEMGAGKTTFTCEVVRNLVKEATPSSPTFNIINQYANNIFHADLYRIKDVTELFNIGFFELLEQDNIIFIEWPSKIDNELIHSRARKVYNVNIEVQSENKRKITFN